MGNPNYQLLVDAAKLLRPILGELVFVGGCSTGLLVTDRAAADVRPTTDVDAIAEITSYVGYIELSERLKKLGFREDAREGAPRCRWRQNTTTLDVMPVDGTLFGFRNVWYGPAVKAAEIRELEPGLSILLVRLGIFLRFEIRSLPRPGKGRLHRESRFGRCHCRS
jgi:hypothetical protein